jgi:hypothetical protein
LRRATAGLVAIVAAVRERAPDARVLLVDYLTILDPDAPWTRATPFEPGTRDALREVGRLLAVVFRTAAQESGTELVAVSALGAEAGGRGRTGGARARAACPDFVVPPDACGQRPARSPPKEGELTWTSQREAVLVSGARVPAQGERQDGG